MILISACKNASTYLPEPGRKEELQKLQKSCEATLGSDPPNRKSVKFKQLSSTVHRLQAKLAVVTKQRDTLKAKEYKYKQQINSLQKDLEKAKLQITNTLSKTLNGIFSPTQIQSFQTGKPVTRWTEEDIAKAVTLRSLSPKAYRFIRDKWKIPLPAKSTISRWMSKINIEPGVLLPIIRLLKQKCATMSDIERLCAISFDESSVCQEWSYDQGKDTLYEPKQKVQCVMLRGVAAPWKQIIYFNFDTDMTKDILFDLIQKVETAGFIIVSMVSDLGSTNMRLWKALDINLNNTSFTNPADSTRQIYVFADAPHLLKLVRNNLLDHGFTLDDNSKRAVTSSSVREIIIRSEHDLKTAHRLSHKHINVQGVQRMRVYLAAQLLSETTSKTIKYFGRDGLLKSKDWHDTSEFIQLIDLWFDTFNSRSAITIKNSRKGYGLNLPEQEQTLHLVINTMKKMRVAGKNILYPFQKGMIVSCQSLIKLYEFLKTKFGLNYILTNRLNQDGLEHFFGYMRQMGGCHQHPNAVQVKHRIKIFLLGKNCELVGSNYNTDKENKDVSLSQENFVAFSDNVSESFACSDNASDSVESELMLSAMLFTCEPSIDSENYDLDVSEEEQKLEHCMEAEGLRYIGGFIARRFPQHAFLGNHVRADDDTWIGEICREQGKLMTPSPDFYEKLNLMEKLFKCYHGEKLLKPGKACKSNLTKIICKHVNLPEKVIAYFVRLRVFLRIRNLNRNNRKYSNIVQKKLKKIIT